MTIKRIRRQRAIHTIDPGPKSLDEEIEDVFNEIVGSLSELDDPKLAEQWRDTLGDFVRTGDVKLLAELTKWRRQVVPLDEFLFGKGYLGLRDNEVYPGILEALWEVDSDRYDEVVLKGAIGIGKTTLANLAMARDLYKLSCMRSPHFTYGIATGTPIVFTIQSVRLSTARKVVFNEFGRYIRTSPYFKSKFMFDKFITSEMIFREHNISIMPVSSSGSAVISMNVIGGQMDEVNFMQKNLKSKSSEADEQGSFDQARQLYNTLASRRKSRFTEREDLPGALYLISSSRFPDDFTEQKAAESTMRGGDDDRMFVFEGSQWSVKGRDRFSKEEFTVQIGNETYPSKVIPRDPETGKDLQKPDPGCDVIHVPMNWWKDFNRDVEGQLRDTAGMTTLSTHPFITQRNKIAEAMALAKENNYENPLSLEQAEFSMGLPELDAKLTRTDVKSPRHAHIDLGISKDACGIAVGHLAGYKVTEDTNDKGKRTTEVLPIIAYDVILRVVPPMGGEIQLEDVRKFLRKLNSRYKLNIESVSFDGFQSVDSRQLLNKAGFKTSYLSVEKVEPWRSFRDALYDGRIMLPAHNWLAKELAEVETTITPGNKEKIDHRPNGTKDVADGVVGVAAFLLHRRKNWNGAQFVGGRTGNFMLGSKYASQRGRPDNVTGSMANRQPGSGHRSASVRKPTQRRSIERK